jgi:hypothetical protein
MWVIDSALAENVLRKTTGSTVNKINLNISEIRCEIRRAISTSLCHWQMISK